MVYGLVQYSNNKNLLVLNIRVERWSREEVKKFFNPLPLLSCESQMFVKETQIEKTSLWDNRNLNLSDCSCNPLSSVIMMHEQRDAMFSKEVWWVAVNGDLNASFLMEIFFMSSTNAFHSVAEVSFIVKSLHLTADGVLTWQSKYNLMKLSFSVDIPGHQMFMNPRFCCCSPLALPSNNTVYFSEDILSAESSLCTLLNGDILFELPVLLVSVAFWLTGYTVDPVTLPEEDVLICRIFN